MKERLIPFASFRSIYDIPVSFYKENGISTVLSDLDNTLDPYTSNLPSERARELARRLQKEGLAFCIASNKLSRKAKRYGAALGVRTYGGLLKPWGFRLRKLLADEGFDPAKTVLIGDQLLTDVAAGNRAGIKTILTEPLTELDPPWTRLNRFLERKRRKKALAVLAERGKAR
jgi:HAD superfamily phosphatase (TIGR01668 family)